VVSLTCHCFQQPYLFEMEDGAICQQKHAE
jgi:hypothetical protein